MRLFKKQIFMSEHKKINRLEFERYTNLSGIAIWDYTAPPNQNLVSKNRLFWFFLLFYWVHILGSENYFFEIFHRWNSEKNMFFYFRPNIPNNVDKMVSWSGFWVFWVTSFTTLANKSNPMLRNFFWLHPSSLVPGL